MALSNRLASVSSALAELDATSMSTTQSASGERLFAALLSNFRAVAFIYIFLFEEIVHPAAH